MWHEARRSERKVHDLMDAARKRSQRRALYLAKRRGDPHQAFQVVGTRCRAHRDDGLYQAAQDQQGLIPWNGKQDILIDRFDGRALLDFIRDSSSRAFKVPEKTEEEEELEEFVNFERYRDLIKHRRRGFNDEEGLQHVYLELEAKSLPFSTTRSSETQPTGNKGSYSQVAFSYKGDINEEHHNAHSDDEDEDEEDEEDEKDFSSDDSNDEGLERIAKEFGVKRYNWLVYMEKKAQEEEKRQKEIIKGDPAVRKLSRKERRKASQIERGRDRGVARGAGKMPYRDPYRESRRSPTYEAYPWRRSRSRSSSPSHSRRHNNSSYGDHRHRSKTKTGRIEYITEFGGSNDMDDTRFEGISPPSSPFQAEILERPSGGRILEALHTDPASAPSSEQEKTSKLLKQSISTSSPAISKLSKTSAMGPSKALEGEKKETPQERLKRIMSKQLNKQIKKDTAADLAKKREQERQRQERLAETNRTDRYSRSSRSRSRSRSPPRRRWYRRSHSRSASPRKHYSRSRSRSKSSSPLPSYSRSPRSRNRVRH